MPHSFYLLLMVKGLLSTLGGTKILDLDVGRKCKQLLPSDTKNIKGAIFFSAHMHYLVNQSVLYKDSKLAKLYIFCRIRFPEVKMLPKAYFLI